MRVAGVHAALTLTHNHVVHVDLNIHLVGSYTLSNKHSKLHSQPLDPSNAGHNLPGIAWQFATQNRGFAMHCCIMSPQMYEACMLDGRGIMQALGRVAGIATRQM